MQPNPTRPAHDTAASPTSGAARELRRFIVGGAVALTLLLGAAHHCFFELESSALAAVAQGVGALQQKLAAQAVSAGPQK